MLLACSFTNSSVTFLLETPSLSKTTQEKEKRRKKRERRPKKERVLEATIETVKENPQV
jgi:hypothetical protein